MRIFSDGGGGWRSAEAKRCDHCNSAAAVVFFGSHGAFLCMPCHERLLRHERSWICDVCEQNPAAFTCKADAANLCPACDRDVHAANPLAQRHHRIPAVPFYDTAESFLLRATSDDGHMLVSGGNYDDLFAEMENCVSRDNGYMGNVPMNISAKITETDTKSSSLDHLLFSDIIDDDQFFEFDPTLRTYGDSIVPVQTSSSLSIIPVQTSNPHDHHLLKNQFELYNHNPSSASYCNSFNTQSLSVSSSTLDMGIVPERSMISDSSNSFSKQSRFDVGVVCSGNQEAHATTAKDVREAKVMRYREKRKNRKFEKTVRYASRKAYAESRPRIKGRFAKRSADYQSDLDFDDDGEFGAIAANFIVPSFLNDDNLNNIYA